MKKDNSYPPSDREKKLITKIKIFVLRNIGKDFPLSYIAAKCKATEYFLTYRFPQICEQSVIEYRRKQRLLKGAKQLATGLPIKRIASEAGYNTPNDFNRAFKKNFGVTPYRYIKEYMRKK